MLLLALLLLQTAAPMAMPTDKTVICPAKPTPLPAALAGWSTMTTVTAGATAATAATLMLGRGVRATLRAAATVTLPLPLPVGKPTATGSSSGVFAFDVPTAGRYRIALGAGVWVDVGANGKTLMSVAHGHGPACSTVRKTVDFDLNRGRHLLRVVGSAAPALALMVAPVR